MDYEVTKHVSHYVYSDHDKGGLLVVEDITWYNLNVSDLDKEELLKVMEVVKPIYEDHITKEGDAELLEYKQHKKRCHEQCKGGL